MRPLLLLGPQRHQPTLVEALDRLGVEGQVAAVTAGWQEREAEVEEMREHLGRPVVDLCLHLRCERAFEADPELFEAHRARQDKLRRMQQLYRYRLDFTYKPARGLMRRRGEAELLEPERQAALEALRRLDREHLERIAAVNREFDQRHEPLARPAIAEQREEIAGILAESRALAIAGGHVAVLLNRLRLLGVAETLHEAMPVIAWSAGAMALAERIVLFHDNPPQGAGNAEVLENGLGLFEGLLPLPHAERRLQLQDSRRVALLARRFAPEACVALDPGTVVSREDGGWRSVAAAKRLDPAGGVEELEAA